MNHYSSFLPSRTMGQLSDDWLNTTKISLMDKLIIRREKMATSVVDGGPVVVVEAMEGE